jgi:hypothetical protein
LHSQVDLWAGKEDGIPDKMVTEGETRSAMKSLANYESQIQTVRAMTTTFISVDEAISIHRSAMCISRGFESFCNHEDQATIERTLVG